jgi:preprotein translocase subunit SecE
MKKNPEEKVEYSRAAGRIEALKMYFEQARVELRKVVWPSKQEAIATSTAVIILVVVMAVFLGLVDLALAKLMQALLS